MTSKVLHYDLANTPPRAVGGSGATVVDADGVSWLDATGGAGAVTLGYGITEIQDAIADQAGRLPFVYLRHFTTSALEELAELVVAIAPPGIARAYFVTGGSEANESAIKIARLYQLERGATSKSQIVSFWPSYHGSTLMTLSLSGRPSWTTPFAPLLHRSEMVDRPYDRWRRPVDMTEADYAARCVAELDLHIERVGAEQVSAVIAEPIIGGTAPAVSPPAAFWPLVRQLCDRHDILLIMDEVLTGFGRTGRVFASQHWALEPDLITCGKGISSGYAPLGAVLVNEKVAGALEEGAGALRHSFTYAGHPITAAAGLAAVRYLVDHEMAARSADLGRYLSTQLKALKDHPCVAEVRSGRGLLAGIEFATDTELDAGAHRAAYVTKHARRNHVLMSPGTNGDQIQLMPPIAITPAEIDRIAEVLIVGVERSLDETPFGSVPR